ncbi:MAG TPA: hypothetical protein ENK78_08665 [Thiothrix sp.]|nr:hypothetical protein [Thiothrix sp.]
MADFANTPTCLSTTMDKQAQANCLLKAIIEEQHELGDLGRQLEYLLRLRGARLHTDPTSSRAYH